MHRKRYDEQVICAKCQASQDGNDHHKYLGFSVSGSADSDVLSLLLRAEVTEASFWDLSRLESMVSALIGALQQGIG